MNAIFLAIFLTIPSCMAMGLQAPGCSETGVCDSEPVSVSEAASLQDCQATCQESEACHYFSYHPEETTCLIFAQCDSVLTDTGCQNCVTAAKDCEGQARNEGKTCKSEYCICKLKNCSQVCHTISDDICSSKRVTATFGYITSPADPIGQYFNNIDCSVTLSNSDDLVYELEFVSFDVSSFVRYFATDLVNPFLLAGGEARELSV